MHARESYQRAFWDVTAAEPNRFRGTNWFHLAFLLFGIVLIGISAAIWFNNENLAVWAFSQGWTDEGGVGTLPDTIRLGASATGVAGLSVIGTWALLLIYAWSRVHGLVTRLARTARAWVGHAASEIAANTIVLGALSARLVRRLRNGTLAVFRPLWLVTTALARPVGLALKHVWLGISAVTGLILRIVSLLILTPLDYLGHGVSTAFGFARLATFAGLRYAGLAIQLLWLGVLNALKLGLALVAGLILVPAYFLGRGIAVALRYCRSVGSTTFRRAVSLVDAYLLSPLYYLWRGISAGTTGAWTASVTALLTLSVGLKAAIEHVGRRLVAFHRSLWLRISATFKLVLRIASLLIVTLLGYLGRGLSTSFQFAWLTSVACLSYAILAMRRLGVGISSASKLGLALVTGLMLIPAYLLGRGVATALRYCESVVSTALERAIALIDAYLLSPLYHLWRGISAGTIGAWTASVTALLTLSVGLKAAIEHEGQRLVAFLRSLWLGISAILRLIAWIASMLFLTPALQRVISCSERRRCSDSHGQRSRSDCATQAW